MQTPVERVTPASVDELAVFIARCDREGVAIAIEGGNTLHGMGLAPSAGITLSTLGLNRIVEDAPADLTVAVQSGVRLQTLAATLARHGTFVPFDAPFAADATVGGTLAAGWLGPRRHLYGRPRDYILGTIAVLADGTIAHAGGMVVKNVAGYDMSRLYTGSFGTLCILAQANMKTLPLPTHARFFLAKLPEGTRTRALGYCSSLPITPSAVFWIDGFSRAIDGDDGPEGRLLVLIEGSDALMERATRDLRSAIGRAGVPETRIADAGARESLARVIDAYVSSITERSITYRMAATPEDAESRALALRALAERFELRNDIIVDAMNGDIIFRVSDLDAHALAGKIEMFDDALHDDEPRASVIAGDHPARALLQVWGAPPESLDRMRELKARFDPNGTLNAGRFVGGI